MKVWNEDRFFDGKKRLFTVFAWTEDIEISLDAFEFESDSWSEEPKGDTFYEKYSPKDVIKALKKAIELSEAGWEEVCLTFRPKKEDDKRLASFTFRIYEIGVQAIFSVNKEVLLSKCGEKLAKIKRILEEDEGC